VKRWLALAPIVAAPLAAGLLALLLLFAGTTDAATRGSDAASWPCVQRLVPKLTASAYWGGPPIENGEAWKSEPRIVELVNRITPRRVAAPEGETAIASFADTLGPGEDRKRLLALLLAGLTEETNRERDALIARIKELGRRQSELAQIASEAGTELGKIPPDATGEAAERRQDLEQRVAFVTRAFEGGERTVRYVCQAPVQLEGRLGAYARAIEARL
jgi:hypothetical protein